MEVYAAAAAAALTFLMMLEVESVLLCLSLYLLLKLYCSKYVCVLLNEFDEMAAALTEKRVQRSIDLILHCVPDSIKAASTSNGPH